MIGVSEFARLVRDDPHAPRYHFVAPHRRSRCSDPNGAIFWKGRYHLFYIFQDERLRSGPEFWQEGHCWGHASSTDLVHWTHHPTALAPRAGDPDAAIFSGCALVNKQGVPTIVYHGVKAGTCVATAVDDDLIEWRKHPANPVIREPTKPGDVGWGVYNVFDPCAWREGDAYYAILGGQVKPDDAYDTAYLFTSTDLENWEYLRPFYEPNPQWTEKGDDCACPKFFELGGRHVLLCISHAKGMRYYVGDYLKDGRDRRFVPTSHHLLNWPGGSCFAPETMLAPDGRRIVWGWAQDQRVDWWKAGEWGVVTLPRLISLCDDGESMRVAPAAELVALRRNHREVNAQVPRKGAEASLRDIAGECVELLLEADVAGHGRVELIVRASPDGAERTVIAYDGAAGEVSIDVSRSSTDANGWRPYPMDFWRGFTPANLTRQAAPLALGAGEALRLRVFVDRSIIEVFANGRLCLTQRVYPTRPDSSGVALRVAGGATVSRLEAWDMDEINAR